MGSCFSDTQCDSHTHYVPAQNSTYSISPPPRDVRYNPLYLQPTPPPYPPDYQTFHNDQNSQRYYSPAPTHPYQPIKLW